MRSRDGLTMMQLRPWRDEDLGVVISLAVAFGMIVGALAVLWIAGGGFGRIAWWLS